MSKLHWFECLVHCNDLHVFFYQMVCYYICSAIKFHKKIKLPGQILQWQMGWILKSVWKKVRSFSKIVHQQQESQSTQFAQINNL